jgi:hypothetical protein
MTPGLTGLPPSKLATLSRTAQAPKARGDPAGVSLIEVLIMILIISIMSMLVVHAAAAKLQKAQLARCFAELRSIQARIYADFLEGGLPNPDTFWDVYWHGVKPGPYYYLIDDNDPDSGHGGDLDAFDENNPGNAPRRGKDIKFVVLCQHDHGDLARYVYVEDDGPPTVADATNDPHYERHLPRAADARPRSP